MTVKTSDAYQDNLEKFFELQTADQAMERRSITSTAVTLSSSLSPDIVYIAFNESLTETIWYRTDGTTPVIEYGVDPDIEVGIPIPANKEHEIVRIDNDETDYSIVAVCAGSADLTLYIKTTK